MKSLIFYGKEGFRQNSWRACINENFWIGDGPPPPPLLVPKSSWKTYISEVKVEAVTNVKVPIFYYCICIFIAFFHIRSTDVYKMKEKNIQIAFMFIISIPDICNRRDDWHFTSIFSDSLPLFSFDMHPDSAVITIDSSSVHAVKWHC